ncbi:hypothetical protein K1719_028380 [Acacia pycnantha]|nr:hypothetical protein K1719_028380 [Acacia pycnantha]
MNPVVEAKFWHREATVLRQNLEHLQELHRQFMGEQLSGLGINELKSLENQLEMSLKKVQIKKDQILSDEIKELEHKGQQIYQEKVELHKTIEVIRKENAELQAKIYEARVVNEENGDSNPAYSISNKYGSHAPMHLQPSQPQSQSSDESPAKAMELGRKSLQTDEDSPHHAATNFAEREMFHQESFLLLLIKVHTCILDMSLYILDNAAIKCAKVLNYLVSRYVVIRRME